MEELIGLLDKIAKDIEFHSAIDDGDEEEIRRIADDYESEDTIFKNSKKFTKELIDINIQTLQNT